MIAKFWRKDARKRSEKARKAAEARWAKHHESKDDEPLREVRTVRITITDSHRPTEIITLRRFQDDEGHWKRWRLLGVSARPMGPTGIGRLIANFIQ